LPVNYVVFYYASNAPHDGIFLGEAAVYGNDMLDFAGLDGEDMRLHSQQRRAIGHRAFA